MHQSINFYSNIGVVLGGSNLPALPRISLMNSKFELIKRFEVVVVANDTSKNKSKKLPLIS